jgi:glucoamylase
VGSSDPWQDLSTNKQLTKIYPRALDGNIGLAGEIDLEACGGTFVLALSFGKNATEAGLLAKESLLCDFDWLLMQYLEGWREVQKKFIDLSWVDPEGGRLFRTSTMVIKIHEGKHHSGSVIASLSIPWGHTKGDNDLGGYHLIWPRDQVETAQAMIACGDFESARTILLFLMASQEQDGHWPQCMWSDGSSYWIGLQMDETALPILLADSLKREEALEGINPFKMVDKATKFLLRNGPSTREDRWEENPGYTPFTIAAEVAGLLAAADFYQDAGMDEAAKYTREIADWWNYSIENWLYVKDTYIAKRYDVEGYYVRASPGEGPDEGNVYTGKIVIKNRLANESLKLCSEIVSVDALALVRFGVRDPNDPRILNTVKVIDGMLKTDTAKGNIWHRYNEDGYGDKADGSAFDGTGIGRGWPLLIGERAHYEIAKGDRQEALRLLRLMASYAGVGGLLPEQIWDAPDIPEKKLFNGHSAGSAKPLVWAHAEYISLLRSILDNRIFRMPPQTVHRYLQRKTAPVIGLWRFDHPLYLLPKGLNLRIQSEKPATVRWSIDNWKSYNDIQLKENSLGIYFADLPVKKSSVGTRVSFTFYWPEVDKWEERNYDVQFVP